MEGLDLLGATRLAETYITLRVTDVDKAKLKAAIGGSTGSLAAGALTMVEASPKAALDAALPIALAEAKKYGITAEARTSDAPQYPRRAMSEFWPGLLAGATLGASGLLIAKLIGKMFGRSA